MLGWLLELLKIRAEYSGSDSCLMNRHLKYVVFIIQHAKIILCSSLNIIQFFMSEFLLVGNNLFLVTVVWLWYAVSSTRHSLEVFQLMLFSSEEPTLFIA